VDLRRWVDRWSAYWFPTTTTLPLALTRIGMVAAQLFWFFPSLERPLNLLRKNPDFLEPQLFIRAVAAVVPRHTLFTPSGLTALYWMTAVAGLAALVGLCTRVSLFLFALGTWILIAHLYSYADVHHEAALFCIVLMCLAFAPSGGRLSLDALIRRRRGRDASDLTDTAMWPIRLAHVLLAITYLSAGATKLIDGGPAWLNGYTLQSYIFADAVPRGFPLGIWLAQHHTLCIALSVFTVAFESSFILSLFLPWTAPAFFLTGILFHVGLYEAAGHDFFQHIVMLALLLVVVTPDWLRAWWIRPRALRLVRRRPLAPA
jgi:hypothetical protein